MRYSCLIRNFSSPPSTKADRARNVRRAWQRSQARLYGSRLWHNLTQVHVARRILDSTEIQLKGQQRRGQLMVWRHGLSGSKT